MAGHSLWFFMLITIQFSLVLCRNDYFDYYYNKYHKGHSTTERISSSASDVSPEEASVSDDSSLGNLMLSTTDDHKIINVTALAYGDTFEQQMQYTFFIRVVIIVGSIVAFLCIIGCIVCCCPQCRRTERRGFIMGNSAGIVTGAQRQPMLSPYPQQPGVVQHYLPPYAQDTMQQFPPHYQPQPMQQQSQYLPGQPQYQQSPTALQSQYSPGQPQQQQSPTALQSQYSPDQPQYQKSSTALQSQYSPGQPQHQQSPTALEFSNPPEEPPSYNTAVAPKY